MKYVYTATITPADGIFYVRVPDLPGCITTGHDVFDAVAMGTDALSLWLTSAEEDGASIPAASEPGTIETEAPAFTTLLCADTDAYRAVNPPEDAS